MESGRHCRLARATLGTVGQLDFLVGNLRCQLRVYSLRNTYFGITARQDYYLSAQHGLSFRILGKDSPAEPELPMDDTANLRGPRRNRWVSHDIENPGSGPHHEVVERPV